MAGSNTTGIPNVDDYRLGRGIVYIALLDANNKPTKYRDLGNCTEFNVTAESESLTHYSSRGGLKITDKETPLSLDVGVNFTIDELNHNNLADFFTGATATHVNVSVAGFAEYQMVADGDLEAGYWYDIVNSSGERAYDVQLADLTIEQAGTATALTGALQGTTGATTSDYVLDSKMGRIRIRNTSTVQTAITAGDGLDVTLAANAGGNDVQEVRALTLTSLNVALKFVSNNAADDGEQEEWQFHKVTLKANGDIALIGDEWATMAFEGKAERNPQVDELSPTLTIRYVEPD